MNESFVTVVGNVVSDPISRPTKVGRPFASLRIASTTRRWDAEKRAFVDGSTNFLNVVAFNALAANVMTSVKKGHPVVVYGRLRVNQWETEKGEPRTSAEIDAFTIGHDLTRGQVEFSRRRGSSSTPTTGWPTRRSRTRSTARPRGPTGRTSPVCGERGGLDRRGRGRAGRLRPERVRAAGRGRRHRRLRRRERRLSEPAWGATGR